MTVMLPTCCGVARRQANASGADELPISGTTLDLSRNLGGPRQVVDHHRVRNRRFGGDEWAFFDDCRVHRAPAGVLAVGDQTIPVSRGTAVRLTNGEDAVVGEDHGNLLVIYTSVPRITFRNGQLERL